MTRLMNCIRTCIKTLTSFWYWKSRRLNLSKSIIKLNFTCTLHGCCVPFMMICSLGTFAGRIRNSCAIIACSRRGIKTMILRIWRWDAKSYVLSSMSSLARRRAQWIRWRWRSQWSTRASTSTPSSTTWFKASCSCTLILKISIANRSMKATRPSKERGKPRARIGSSGALRVDRRVPQWVRAPTSTYSKSTRSTAISRRLSSSKSYMRSTRLLRTAGMPRHTLTEIFMRGSSAKWTSYAKISTFTTTC